MQYLEKQEDEKSNEETLKKHFLALDATGTFYGYKIPYTVLRSISFQYDIRQDSMSYLGKCRRSYHHWTLHCDAASLFPDRRWAHFLPSFSKLYRIDEQKAVK